ncbi:MAG: co-chaperone GroES [Pseudobdellovibrionaceae bacterium]
MAKAKKKAPAKKAVAKKAAPKKAAQKTQAKKAAALKAKSKVAAKPASKTKAKPATKPSAKTVAKSSSKMAAKPAPKAAVQTASKTATKTNIKWDQFLTPLDDRVIVQVSEGERMTAGGLYIPDTVSDTSGNFHGLVLVAGRGHLDAKGKVHAMDVQAGDSIVFSAFAGAKMDLMGQEVRILRESEIMGIVTKK